MELSRELPVKAFSPSHASQILAAPINSGVVFKNRHGKYSFAVPLPGDFIRRQYPAEEPELFDQVLRPNRRGRPSVAQPTNSYTATFA